jgi:hypothetical protein
LVSSNQPIRSQPHAARVTRSLEVQARRREALAKYLPPLIVCVFFVALLSAGLLTRSYLLSAQPKSETVVTTNDTARRARLTYRLADGVSCRHELFDNDFAEVSKSTIVPCDDEMQISKRPSRSRTGFSWGKR